VSKGADVINLSLGHYGSGDAVLESAINAAAASGVVCVAAAGNDATNDSHYPSDYDTCISVSATDWNDSLASYSNFGSNVEISAPGGDSNSMPDSMILSTCYDANTHSSGYAYMTGTSMASPMVAGVIALMLSADPDLSVTEVRNILKGTAVDLGTPGRDNDFGYGRVNAQAAVAAVAADAAVEGFSLSPSSATLAVNQTFQLTPSFSPTNASNKNVSYSSNTPSVATVSPAGVITAVSKGTAVITGTTEDGGFQDTCQVTVKSGLIESDVYTIDRTNKVIKGIAVNTSVSQFKANLKNASGDIKIHDASGTLYTGSKLCTGMTVKLEFGTGTHDSLSIALTGDTNGDGGISISDYTKIRLHILGLSNLSGAPAAAADVDKSGVINIADYTYVRLHILGVESLY
jgi:hypothetical protein